MIEALTWWVAIEAIGAIAFPIAFIAFRFLPDRGFSFSKTVGLLLVSYTLWVGASARLIPNRYWAIVLLLALLATASSLIAFRQRRTLLEFLKQRWLHLAFLQALFIVAYVLALFLRSYVADLSVGERPTDSGIVNAISRAEYFPPEDPWLSGHSINYYYFGHLEVATLSKLTLVPTRISFNLALASVTALAALGIAGTAYNLIALRTRSRSVLFFAALAPVFYLVLANVEGAIELMAAHGLGSTGFYDLVGIKGLEGPSDSTSWYPTQPFWWGRANSFATGWPDRLFPFFRLFQGELHSEVLSMPLVTVAIGLALNVWRSLDLPGSRRSWVQAADFAFIALVLGAMAFTAIWDVPTFGLLLVIAFGLATFREGKVVWAALRRAGLFALALPAAAVLLFLPAYFLSYGPFGGIELTRAADATRLNHFLIMWLPVLAIIGTLAVASMGRPARPRLAASAVGALFAVVFLPWALLTVARGGLSELIDEITGRGSNLLTLALIGALLFAVVLALIYQLTAAKREEGHLPVAAFALVLSGLTLILILGVEFYWVKDTYWVPRINTLNKISFQGWAMSGAAGALGLYLFAAGFLKRNGWTRLRRVGAAAWALPAAVFILAGLVFPVTATFYVTDSFSGSRFLDGMNFVRETRPGDYEAVIWLTKNVEDTPVVMEAVGDSHTDYARVSAYTGLPTVLGWPLHEFFFRGSYDPQGNRREEVQLAYQSTDPSTVKRILERYNVQYVYLGPLERDAYGEVHPDVFA
jgi:YYY domain-containing protein